MGAFVLEFAVGIDADDEAAVTEFVGQAAERAGLEIGGGEIFRLGVAPVADGGEPSVSHLGPGGAHFVGRREVEKEDADFDIVFLQVGAGGEPDGSDYDIFAPRSASFLLGEVGDGDLPLEHGNRGRSLRRAGRGRRELDAR